MKKTIFNLMCLSILCLFSNSIIFKASNDIAYFKVNYVGETHQEYKPRVNKKENKDKGGLIVEDDNPDTSYLYGVNISIEKY